MKKWICCILAVVLVLLLAIGVYAEETTCLISGDPLTAEPGETVTVPIRISGNPGFTNFAVELHYDSAALTLTAIEDVAGDVTSVNLAWADGDGILRGYVVSASAEVITADTVLFNAVFTVGADFSGSTEITPVVTYIRNNSAVFSVFQELTATVQSGTLEVEEAIVLGDVNGDGIVNLKDAVLVRAYLNGRYAGADNFARVADVNGDGKINMRDAVMIYAYANDTIAAFSAGQ